MDNETRQSLITIMVVEPEVLIRTTISEYLRGCGYRVIEGVCAQDVHTLIRSGERVDIVFSEVQLPGELSGFALAKSLRQTHPEIDVILTAGIADAAEKSSEICGQGPIAKPYHPQNVAARIHLLLERRRTTR